MKINCLIILLICALVVTTKAQINLVRNPSFENYISCPHDYALTANANYWSAIVDTGYSLDTNFVYHFVMGTITHLDGNCFPNYCNACNRDTSRPGSDGAIPAGGFYYRFPRTGNGMMLVDMYENAYDTGTWDERMYLQGRLYHNLIAGKTYCFTYYVVEAQCSNVGCKIGAFFDDGTIDTTTECGKPKTWCLPQLLSDSIITDTTNWHKIQGSFTATGTERFITIGDFFDSTHTSYTIWRGDSSYELAAYLIDDVSVIAIDDSANAGTDHVINNLSDSVWVGDSSGFLPCYWYSSTVGSSVWRLIDSNKAGFKVKPDSTTKYVMQLDVCGNITTDTAVVWVVPVGLIDISVLKNQQYSLCPNPNNGNITLHQLITDINPVTVELHNITGSSVYKSQLTFTNQSADLNFGNIISGLYLLQVRDNKGGNCLVLKKVYTYKV